LAHRCCGPSTRVSGPSPDHARTKPAQRARTRPGRATLNPSRRRTPTPIKSLRPETRREHRGDAPRGSRPDKTRINPGTPQSRPFPENWRQHATTRDNTRQEFPAAVYVKGETQRARFCLGERFRRGNTARIAQNFASLLPPPAKLLWQTGSPGIHNNPNALGLLWIPGKGTHLGSFKSKTIAAWRWWWWWWCPTRLSRAGARPICAAKTGRTLIRDQGRREIDARPFFRVRFCSRARPSRD